MRCLWKSLIIFIVLIFLLKMVDGIIEFPSIDPPAKTTFQRLDQLGILPGSLFGRLLADNTIPAAKIKNITWDKGQGGTLTLGGVGNVNGILNILDSGGVNRITADNNGLTISNGKITIKDANSNTTIDSNGLVSNNNANFTLNGIFQNSLITITNSSADLTGSTITFTVVRSQKILAFATVLANVVSNNDTEYVDIYINIDGTNQNPKARLGMGNGLATDHIYPYNSVTTHIFTTLTAGTHTIKLTATASGVLGTQIFDRQLSYVLLGN